MRSKSVYVAILVALILVCAMTRFGTKAQVGVSGTAPAAGALVESTIPSASYPDNTWQLVPFSNVRFDTANLTNFGRNPIYVSPNAGRGLYMAEAIVEFDGSGLAQGVRKIQILDQFNAVLAEAEIEYGGAGGTIGVSTTFLAQSGDSIKVVVINTDVNGGRYQLTGARHLSVSRISSY